MDRIIDLSQILSENALVYPGDPKFSKCEVSHVSKEKCTISRISMSSHFGTHVDAPSHFIDGGAAVDTMPLGLFVGKALVVDADIKDGIISAERLKTKLAASTGEKILILRTGWESRLGRAEYFTDIPVFSEKIADVLINAGFGTIALDMPSVACLEGTREMHLDLLGKGIVIVESLVNVGKITAKSVFFSAAPLKIEGCDGAPTRAYAIEHKD